MRHDERKINDPNTEGTKLSTMICLLCKWWQKGEEDSNKHANLVDLLLLVCGASCTRFFFPVALMEASLSSCCSSCSCDYGRSEDKQRDSFEEILDAMFSYLFKTFPARLVLVQKTWVDAMPPFPAVAIY